MFGLSEEEKEKADQMNNLSKWLIAAFTPWTVDEHGTIKTQFEFSNLGLLILVKAWDNSNASKINKQRFKSIQTILHRKYVLASI